MRLIATKDFKWAHRGCIVEEFKKGQEIETEDEDLIRVSTEESWAEDADKPAENKARKGAPETK